MSTMMAQMIKMMQEIFEALPPRKEDMSYVHNSDHENPRIIDNHDEIHGEIQHDLVTDDHGDEFNIVEMLSDQINVIVDLTVKVEVNDELTINMKLQSVMNKSVKDPIHFLAIEEEVPTEEVEKFDSCSFDNGNKVRATKTSPNKERKKLEVIIPRKTI
ncbi:hypothetical protein J1N35_040505 [Gossypium stocksii]|uniref:Uncharacterized protein n=1 Tax=Gossypium stocksii TaxID=47602 RepID=A0A9D3UDP4_9ROSI|nr:hypothetical protein J1N35_040505 [Gossypium stocksii]